MPEAAVLRCPGCGAPATTDLHACSHCSARLATVACPSCFGRVFSGTRHCPHCGTRADRASSAVDERSFSCPRCAGELNPVQVGGVRLRECARCSGVWVAPEDFARVTTDAEQQAAVLAFRADAPPAAVEARVQYLSCPVCGKLMNRNNFQRISGVILDQCKDHGAWLDADELRRIIEFIRAGGVDRARAMQKQALEDERRRLERGWLVTDPAMRPGGVANQEPAPPLLTAALVALIGFFGMD
jgi:Zn-finger nucleic acid-binding protein